MGGANSRPSFPSVYIARSRYDSGELNYIQKNYLKIGTEIGVSLDEFVNKFIKEGKLYSKLLYFALRDGRKNKNPMSYDEFLQGFSMISKGDIEESSSFCFHIFDINNSNKINISQFKMSLEAICNYAFTLGFPLFYIRNSSSIPPSYEEHNKLVNKIVQRTFKDIQIMKFGQFKEWISHYNQIKDFIKYSLERILCKHPILPVSLSLLSFQTPLMLRNDESLLSENQAALIRSWLPEPYCNCHFYSIFSTKANGFALSTLYRNFETKIEHIMKDPSILIIKDTNGNIFGGFLTQGWFKHSEKFYGGEESFMFSLEPKKGVYRYTGDDNNIMFSTTEYLAIGGKFNYFGLKIDEELIAGISHKTFTFNSPQFTPNEEFQIDSVQLWGLIDVTNLKLLFNMDSDDEIDIEELKLKQSEGPSIWEMEGSWVLDEIKGAGYSKNLAPPPEFEEDNDNDSKDRKKRIIMPL